MILEVIGFTIEGCITAQSAGAHRIELCDNPGEGGTTPSYGMIKKAREVLSIDLFPIIRPRGGDFFYSDDEFTIMIEDVRICKDLRCNGVVIGILTADGKVDKERCSQLVNIAYPMSVTFHRAFDRTAEPFQALEDIIEAGCERILTSGHQPTAAEGIDEIAKLIEYANHRIIIMPGSGVRADNIKQLASTGATEFHTSARIAKAGKMNYHNPSLSEKSEQFGVNESEIKKIIELL